MQLSVGSTVGDRYDVEAFIGKGGMQEVYAAFDQTLERRVALKVPQDAKVARKFRASAVISARVNHPNVAKTLDYFEDTKGRFYLVEELVVGANLRELFSQFVRLDPHTVAHVLHHLAKGVAASHRAGVVHRDLKPSNVMVPGGLAFNGVKVTDFGIAMMAEDEVDRAVSGGEETTRSSKTVMGALAYLAPEVVETASKASKPADVWAIAAIAWELLTGAPPFGNGLKAIKSILSTARPNLPSIIGGHPQFGGLSLELHKLIMTCLNAAPLSRPSADELAEQCDQICYSPPNRQSGQIQKYAASTFGFIDADEPAFFHTRSVVADDARPPIGTRVWFAKFPGEPRPRAMPVVPFKVKP